MPKMSKADRLSEAESLMSNIDTGEYASELEAAKDAMEAFTDQRETAEESFAEALAAHEEKEWDERNDALENANNAVEEMSAALTTIEEKIESGIVGIDDNEIDGWRQAVDSAREHLDNLMEV